MSKVTTAQKRRLSNKDRVKTSQVVGQGFIPVRLRKSSQSCINEKNPHSVTDGVSSPRLSRAEASLVPYSARQIQYSQDTQPVFLVPGSGTVLGSGLQGAEMGGQATDGHVGLMSAIALQGWSDGSAPQQSIV